MPALCERGGLIHSDILYKTILYSTIRNREKQSKRKENRENKREYKEIWYFMRFASVYSQNMRKDGKTETDSDNRRIIEQKRTGEGSERKSHGAPDIPGYIASAKTGEEAGDGPNQDRKQQPRRSVDII